MRNAKTERIIEALEPLAGAQGFELVDVELLGTAASSVLRVYLDKTDGLNVDDIAAASSWINACLDELDPFKGSYTLEVSSPGIDRPLRTLEHFARFSGEEASITTAPQKQHNNRSKWTGLLAGVEKGAGTVSIEIDGTSYQLAFADIKKAHIKGKVDFTRKPDGRNDDVV
ncbi:MAG: ribosome maturation factor RimP [Coriobacteriia bacterium]|nr:ribosome maturation factor RimP [Coriobacteriia bacterium]